MSSAAQHFMEHREKQFSPSESPDAANLSFNFAYWEELFFFELQHLNQEQVKQEQVKQDRK